jgi:hypothetical protein
VEIRTKNTSSGKVVDTATSPETETTSAYTWELEFDADDLDGKITYYVYAIDEDDEEISESFQFTVDGDSGSTGNATIEEVEYNDSNVEAGDDIPVKVTTSDDATHVKIFVDEDGEYVELDSDTSGKENSDGDLEWDLVIDDSRSSDDGDTHYYEVRVYSDEDADDEDFDEYDYLDIYYEEN